MDYHQENNRFIMEIPEERKVQNIFKEIMAKYFPHLEINTGIHSCMKFKSPKEVQLKEDFNKICYNQIVKNQRQRDIVKAVREKKNTHYILGSPHRTVSGFLSRNFQGHER